MKKAVLAILFIGLSKLISAQDITIYWTQAHLEDSALKTVAIDLQLNLTKATGLTYTIEPMPEVLPNIGILLNADTNYVSPSIQNCTISSNGTDLLTFTAKYNHGVKYGVYEYLAELGFRFYLPNDLWQVIPSLASPFTVINKIVEPKMSVRDPIISSGLSIQPADSTNQNTIDWYQWIDRNNMRSEYEIAGHNDWSQGVRDSMALIPCSIAEHDSSTDYNQGNMPNVTVPEAIEVWGKYMESNWIAVRDYWHNDPFVNTMRSIDLPDGTLYGNSNYLGCVGSFNTYPTESGYPTPSDQRFILQNRVTEIMQDTFPGTQTWCLSYDAAADTPSVALHPNLNISVTMGFQMETSNIALMNRWTKKMQDDSKLSEYNYLNLPGGGQYPYVALNYFKNVYNRMKEAGTDGTLIELGISKFSTGMHLYAFNNYAKNHTDIEVSRQQFINDMFSSSAVPIKELFDLWSNEDAVTIGSYVYDNKHKYSKYLQLLQEADGLSSGDERNRVNEIKAYMHYLILNDRFMLSDSAMRRPNAEALAKYIVQLTPSKIINSYASIFLVANDDKLYNWDSSFYHTWLPEQTWTNWKPGISGSIDPIWATILPLSDTDIDVNFANDISMYPAFINNYSYNSISSIVSQISSAGLEAKDTVRFTLSPATYFTVIDLNIYAPSGGYITVIYDSLEVAPNPLGNTHLITNFSIDSEDQFYSTEKRINSAEGTSGQFDLTFNDPGRYHFTIAKPTYGGGQFKFVSNGNIIYRSGAIYPTIFETYDSLEEAACYVYVPSGQDKVFLTMSNACTPAACSDTAYLNEQYISNYRNANGDTVLLHTTPDSSLYYLPVATNQDGKFWKMFHTPSNAYSMSLANINNFYFWLQPADPNKVNTAKALNFNIYPNPNSGTFTLIAPSKGEVNVNVYNNMGQNCYAKKYNDLSGGNQINLSNLPAGVYLVKMEQGNKVGTKKLIITK